MILCKQSWVHCLIWNENLMQSLMELLFTDQWGQTAEKHRNLSFLETWTVTNTKGKQLCGKVTCCRFIMKFTECDTSYFIKQWLKVHVVLLEVLTHHFRSCCLCDLNSDKRSDMEMKTLNYYFLRALITSFLMRYFTNRPTHMCQQMRTVYKNHILILL